MNYHLIDLSKKYDFNFDNIIIGKKIQVNDNIKYYIYYQQEENTDISNIDEKIILNKENIPRDIFPKEIYIKLPKIRLIYNMVNYKYKTMNIPIYPSCEITESTINFIKTLENDILKCFTNKNITMSSLISKKNNLDFIKVTNNNAMITSDLNDNIMLNDFKINGMIEMVLRVSYIWRKDNKIGLESELYQIKYYSIPKQLKINFLDTNQNTNQSKINKDISKNNMQKDHVQKDSLQKDLPSIEVKQPSITFRPPSLLEISEMKNKLRKK